MAQINDTQWDSIIKYIQEKLMKELWSMGENQVGDMIVAIDEEDIQKLHEICTLTEYQVQQGKVKAKVKKVVNDNKFQEFWNAYPTSANFSINGMKFTAGRVLRSNYQVCQMLYDKIIGEGVDHDKMIAAVKKQVEILKNESYETGKNNMSYMPAIEPYIRQRKFEAFMDMEEDETHHTNHTSA